ncbi:MAG: hypothetical protein J6K70_01145 [Selenomonadales bacterium]|nr:hypothetical protein [Selenomonadales bacterium]
MTIGILKNNYRFCGGGILITDIYKRETKDIDNKAKRREKGGISYE